MTSPFFGRAARGGLIASRIDGQDTVAATLALDALRATLPPLREISNDEPVEFFCEGQEDLEIVQGGTTLLVSVKDKLMGATALIAEIRQKLTPSLSSGAGNEIYLRVCVLGGLESDARSLSEDIDHLRARMESRSDATAPMNDFVAKWRLDAATAVRVWIDGRSLGRLAHEHHAVFANALRLTFPSTTLTDSAVMEIEKYVVDRVFAPARRSRDCVDLFDLESDIATLMAPQEILAWSADYVASPFGYVKSPGSDDHMRREWKLLQEASRHVTKGWRRGTRAERYILPRVSCLVCNHPMMANLNGRNGYACPDCGFMPFGSLIYACDCGYPILVAANPPIRGAEMFACALRSTREASLQCGRCQRPADPRKVPTRIFFTPFPWPVDSSVDAILIARRMAMGRPKKRYSSDEARLWLEQNEDGEWKSHLPAAEEAVRRDYFLHGLVRLAMIIAVVVGLVVYFF